MSEYYDITFIKSYSWKGFPTIPRTCFKKMKPKKNVVCHKSANDRGALVMMCGRDEKHLPSAAAHWKITTALRTQGFTKFPLQLSSRIGSDSWSYHFLLTYTTGDFFAAYGVHFLVLQNLATQCYYWGR
jgi:hypothetical protein